MAVKYMAGNTEPERTAARSSSVKSFKVITVENSTKKPAARAGLMGEKAYLQNYSTVTLFARFLGWSTSVPLITATW